MNSALMQAAARLNELADRALELRIELTGVEQALRYEIKQLVALLKSDFS